MNKEYVHDENQIEIFHIGDLDLFIPTISEQVVDLLNISPYGECKVDVYSGEGQVPHFHITRKDNKKKKNLSCCIKIFEADYFVHGIHKGTLTNDQIKILDSWLKSPHRNDISRTNWEVIRDLWLIISEYTTPESFRKYKQYIQPNYLSMMK